MLQIKSLFPENATTLATFSPNKNFNINGLNTIRKQQVDHLQEQLTKNIFEHHVIFMFFSEQNQYDAWKDEIIFVAKDFEPNKPKKKDCH